MFLTVPVRVRVPATSANLGPGFDAFGLALRLYDEVTARVAGSGVRVTVTGEGQGELAVDESHLVVRSMYAAFDRLGGRPAGIELTCDNRIPQARGLGSSSAAIVAGLLAARALVDGGAGRLDDAAVLRLASELEGHPDNVAPCLLGGFTIAWAVADCSGSAGEAPRAGMVAEVAAVRPAESSRITLASATSKASPPLVAIELFDRQPENRVLARSRCALVRLVVVCC